MEEPIALKPMSIEVTNITPKGLAPPVPELQFEPTTLRDHTFAGTRALLRSCAKQGNVAAAEGDFKTAASYYERVGDVKVDDPELVKLQVECGARLGLTLLTLGDTSAYAWRQYSLRSRSDVIGYCPREKSFIDPPTELSSELLSLRVYREQGLGDELWGFGQILSQLSRKDFNLLALPPLQFQPSPQLLSTIQLAVSRLPLEIQRRVTVSLLSEPGPACSTHDLVAHLVGSALIDWKGESVVHGPRRLQSWLMTDPGTYASSFVSRSVAVAWRGFQDTKKNTQLSDWVPYLKRLSEQRWTLKALHQAASQDEANLAKELGLRFPPLEAQSFQQQLSYLDGCAYVIGVPGTSLHLSAGLGIPTKVVCPAGQVAPWYWRMDAKPNGGDSRWYQAARVWLGGHEDDRAWAAPAIAALMKETFNDR